MSGTRMTKTLTCLILVTIPVVHFVLIRAAVLMRENYQGNCNILLLFFDQIEDSFFFPSWRKFIGTAYF